MDEFPHSVAPPPSSHHVRSFASRADGHRGTISSSADPSLESLTSSALLNRSGMTIRAVTPDPEVEVEDEADDVLSETHAHVTATPPRTPSRTTLRSASKWDLLGRASPELGGIPSSPDKPRSALSTTTVVAASQFADLPINRAKSRSPIERSRSKTTTEDNRPPPLPLPMDPSPPASVGSYVSRHRFHASRLDNDQAPSSMGYPWTQSAPVLPTPHQKGSIGSKSGRKYLRNQGSYNTLQPRPSCDPRYFPMNVEYAALVQLMKAVQGRMEGYVDYQIGHTGSHWTKGYCYIDVDSGSFMYQKDENGGSEPATTIISDLRGCQVMASTEDPDTILEIITHSGKQHLTLRPHSVQHFDCWLAALLCWKPIRPAGVANKLIKPHTHILAKERRRRNSDATVQNRGDVSLIKVGRMMLWFPERVTQSTEKHRPSNKGKHPYSPIAWQNVSCMLEDTGEFRLQLEHDTFPLQVLQLSQMSRCAVQQLDPSILDQEFCIALYPQYSHVAVSNTIPNHNPVYLCVDTRTAFEAWFVLLRAFTLPEIYGPLVPPPTPDSATNETVSELKNSANVLTDSYRIQRSIFIRVVEAKVNAGYYPNGHEREPSDCYAEVHLDTELRAKTMVRTKTRNPFWREDYEFCDLPTALTDISVVLKQRDPRQRSRGLGTVAGSSGFGGGRGGMSLPGSQDAIIGRVNVTVDELKEEGNRIEGWMPLMSVIKEGVEERVGELYARVEIEELTVLMASEYNVLSKLLHEFKSGLTLHMAKVITDLRRLADTLLQIFQVSDRAEAWLMALAEHEIDGLHKESTAAAALDNPDGAPAPTEARSLADANTLFRGNSLLTKALDTYMKRLGREYLEETLGKHLQHIAEEDMLCEVDPMKLVDNPEQIQKNWKTLLGLTRGIWDAIFRSASKCPLELRKILRHIRAHVIERYGNEHSISYSCVCGFLFLRFFCPAILNPKLFGLLKDHPGQRAQRTLTLLAKVLQGLANRTPFGVKEPWMSPANAFLSTHASELRDYVDSITTIPHALERAVRVVPPAYATPITIHNRLSAPSKEGFLSLPGLIDQPRAFAGLVHMWRRYADATKGAWRKKLESNPEIKEFDELCRGLQERTEHCIANAENAEKPGVMWERRWEEVAEWVTGVPAREGVYERYQRPPTGSSASSSATSGAVSSAGSSGCMMGGIGAPNILAVEKSPPPSGSVGIGFAAMSRIVSSTVEVRTSRGDEEIGYSSVAYAGTAAGSARSRFAIWGGRGGRKPRD